MQRHGKGSEKKIKLKTETDYKELVGLSFFILF